MGYVYKDLEDLKNNLSIIHRIIKQPGDLQLFLISESEDIRKKGCEFTKVVLEEILNQAKSARKIKKQEVSIVDLNQEKELLTGLYEYAPFWQRMGKQKGRVFIPIFHNADQYTNLAQMLFDHQKPGVLSVSKEGYYQVLNPSKRECFDKIYLDINS